MRLYLCGPMTGIKQYNFPKFMEEAKRLRDAGYDVVNPAEHAVSEGFDPIADTDIVCTSEMRRKFLDNDKNLLDECDGMALMDGWGDSAGCKEEVAHFRKTHSSGIVNKVNNWINLRHLYTPYSKTIPIPIQRDGRPATKEDIQAAIDGKPLPAVFATPEEIEAITNGGRCIPPIPLKTTPIQEGIGAALWAERPISERYRGPDPLPVTPPIRTFSTGATRDTDTNKLDFDGFLCPLVLERYAEYMNANRKMADGSVRSSSNWKSGIPQEVYLKSGWRHFFSFWKHCLIGNKALAMVDACALLFNIMGWMHEELKNDNNRTA